MKLTKQRTVIPTILYIAAIIVAGTCDVISKTVIKIFMRDPASSEFLPLVSTTLFCLNMLIYLFLLLFWMLSVQRRLLPSRERSYMLTAALCAVFLMLTRTVKYRMVAEWDVATTEFFWYLTYIPMTLLPALFLMTCIRIKYKPKGRADERLLLIPSFAIIIGVLTNGLHHFAFSPIGNNALVGVIYTYTNEWIILVYRVFAVLCVIIGFVLLTKANRRLRDNKKVALPFIFLLIIFSLEGIDNLLNFYDNLSMFKHPEIISFSAVAIFESCIRNRLIPYNENYAGFFEQMRFPAMITNRSFKPAYRTAESVNATKNG